MSKIQGKVIVVDDEKNVALGYKRNLHNIGCEVDIYDSAKKALSSLTPEWPGILVTDIMMPEMDGLTLMKKVQEMDPELPVVLVTGKGNISMAVQAIRNGAYDFIEKPFETESLQEVVKRALEKRQYVMEVRKLRTEIVAYEESKTLIIGKSPAIGRLRQVIRNVAASHADVLILGETGGYKRNLHNIGCEVDIYDSAKKALSSLSPEWPGILVTDIMMPEMDGLTLMKKVQEMDPELPVVLVTGKGNISMAVQAIRNGAYDFIEKPFETESLQDVVKRALEKRQYVMEVRKLRTEIIAYEESETLIIGKSPAIGRLRQVIRNVAASHADVLILGETGTGKDLVAKCLHQQGYRKEKPFVAINCGALPESIIESELFGHEAGSFTGASQRRIGKFEFANGGTVFLDEIESMPLHLQVKLLRVLQEREIERMGSNKTIPLDIRILAATKIDLRKASARNEFREAP